jgi:hypothetical protein
VTKKSYEIGNVEAETMLTMQNDIDFDQLCLINHRRMNAGELKTFTELLDRLGFLQSSKIKRTDHINHVFVP